jgi:hypothetical protein
MHFPLWQNLLNPGNSSTTYQHHKYKQYHSALYIHYTLLTCQIKAKAKSTSTSNHVNNSTRLASISVKHNWYSFVSTSHIIMEYYTELFWHKIMLVSTIPCSPFYGHECSLTSELKAIAVQPLKKHIPSDFTRLFVMAISKLPSNKILI